VEPNLCSPSVPSWHGQEQRYFRLNLPSGFCSSCFPMKNYVFLIFLCMLHACLSHPYFDDRDNMKCFVQSGAPCGYHTVKLK
jgi:hypothetical protein